MRTRLLASFGTLLIVLGLIIPSAAAATTPLPQLGDFLFLTRSGSTLSESESPSAMVDTGNLAPGDQGSKSLEYTYTGDTAARLYVTTYLAGDLTGELTDDLLACNGPDAFGVHAAYDPDGANLRLQNNVPDQYEGEWSPSQVPLCA